jgi:hypothetical protein
MMKIIGRSLLTWEVVGLLALILVPWMCPICLASNAVLSLLTSLVMIGIRPKTRSGSILLGLFSGLIPGVAFVALGLSLGVAMSCCGISSGAVYFILGTYEAIVGVIAVAWTGATWHRLFPHGNGKLS